MTKIIEFLKKSGWVETTLGECRVGDVVLLIHQQHISRPLTVTRFDCELCLVETSDGVLRADGASVFRVPRPEYKPGTYAEVEYGGTRTTGTLLHNGECAVTATGTIVPLSDVKVVRALWEPGEDDSRLCAPMVAPSLGALKKRPDWCVIDSEGDRWAWLDGKLIIRRDGETDFSPWWISKENADKYISHKDARWEFIAKDEWHKRD